MPDERPFVSGMVTGGHIMPAVEIRAMRCRRDGRVQAGDGEGRFGPADQCQRTPQISKLYLVTVAVTIGVKWTLQRRVLVVILNSP